MHLGIQVQDLAKRADGLRDELLDLAARAEPLVAAQATKQSTWSDDSRQCMLADPMQLPAQQGEPIST